MNSGLIAAFLVMVIMTAFTFFILHMVVASTGDKIRNNVIIQIKSYDVLLQRKEAELQEIRKQIENETKQLKNVKHMGRQYEEVTTGVIISLAADYRHTDFAEDYKNIKDQFSLDRNQIVQIVYEECQQLNHTDYCKLIDGLLEKLSLENTYKLSVFDSDEQLEVMSEILTPDEKNIMKEFITYNGSFHCLSFYHWLSMQQKIKDNKILVRTSGFGDDFNHIGNLIKTQYDKNLCEGFQILVGNKMYDYGIRKYELI